MTISGWHHVALSVTDLDRSVGWYRSVFDLEVQFEERSESRNATILKQGSGPLTVGLVEHGSAQGPFDPTRSGLDHLAITAATRAEIESWADRLSELGVDHSGVIEVPMGAILNFKDPDGIAFAVFWEQG